MYMNKNSAIAYIAILHKLNFQCRVRGRRGTCLLRVVSQ